MWGGGHAARVADVRKLSFALCVVSGALSVLFGLLVLYMGLAMAALGGGAFSASGPGERGLLVGVLAFELVVGLAAWAQAAFFFVAARRLRAEDARTRRTWAVLVSVIAGVTLASLVGLLTGIPALAAGLLTLRDLRREEASAKA